MCESAGSAPKTPGTTEGVQVGGSLDREGLGTRSKATRGCWSAPEALAGSAAPI